MSKKSKAENAAPAEQTVLIPLTVGECEAVLNILATQPYNQVAGLINKIGAEGQKQVGAK